IALAPRSAKANAVSTSPESAFGTVSIIELSKGFLTSILFDLSTQLPARKTFMVSLLLNVVNKTARGFRRCYPKYLARKRPSLNQRFFSAGFELLNLGPDQTRKKPSTGFHECRQRQ